MNSPVLLETDVVLMSKRKCKKNWPERYYHVIDQSMICGKNILATDAMNEDCKENDIQCKELIYSDEDSDEEEEGEIRRRFVLKPEISEVHSASHFSSGRRSKQSSGGFCENDHGGPLVVGHGAGATVIGVISACMTTNITKKCYGPFLYTSVWTHQNLITCVIEEAKQKTCRRLLRSNKASQTILSWDEHNVGPKSRKRNSDDHKSKAKAIDPEKFVFENNGNT